MKEIQGDYIQNPDGTWKKIKTKPTIISRIIDWFKEVLEIIHN